MRDVHCVAVTQHDGVGRWWRLQPMERAIEPNRVGGNRNKFSAHDPIATPINSHHSTFMPPMSNIVIVSAVAWPDVADRPTK